MKAIITKYLPFTNHKPARIKASAEGVPSITTTTEKLYTLAQGGCFTEHQIAARILCATHNWPLNLASGVLPNGTWAHCFVTDSNLKIK